MRFLASTISAALVLSLLSFSGCSWFTKTKEEVTEYAPRVVNSVPTPTPTKREPGSLWSEDSTWNGIYSPTQSRYPGDIITVKLTPILKSKIVAMVDSPERQKDEKEAKEKDAKEKTQGKDKEPARGGKEAQAGAGGGPAASGKDDTQTMEMTILEILPRGIYKVAANKGLHIGAQDPYVTLEAQLREKEVSADETASSDSLFNLRMSVIPTEDLRRTGELAEKAEQKK